jgi:hypothetical protein
MLKTNNLKIRPVIKTRKQEDIEFVKQNTKALRKIVKPVKFNSKKTKTDKIIEETILQGPDLAPLVNRMKNEYPIISKIDQYKEIFTKQNPLVSIIVTTYNNSNLLINIALKSILNQNYKNLQIIVIADHSTDDTDIQMAKIKDTRVIYQNLSKRPNYPINTRQRWTVAGAVPHNLGLELATGDFITYCDHDDSFTIDRTDKLIEFSRQNKCDLIHHPFYIGTSDHIVTHNDSASLICGKITTSAVFHHSWFKQIPVDLNCWKIDEPGDWNKFKKFKEIGAKICRHPEKLSYKR